MGLPVGYSLLVSEQHTFDPHHVIYATKFTAPDGDHYCGTYRSRDRAIRVTRRAARRHARKAARS